MLKHILLLPLLTGCIIVESDKSDNWEDWDTAEWEDESEWDDDWTQDTATTDDTTSDTESTEDSTQSNDVNGSYYTVPNQAAPGDVFMSALRSSDQSTTIDWGDIVNITPYGALEICEFTPLFDELLLTIKVDPEATNSTVDLVIEYANGDVDLVEDGFIIDVSADVGSAATDPTACD